MPSTADRGERQRACGLHFPSFVPVNLPVTEVVCVVQGVARPLELLEPELARVPAALPVVRARVDEDGDPALEQARDVELRGYGKLVEALVESAVDVHVAAAEVVGCLDAQQFPHRGLIEVVLDDCGL